VNKEDALNASMEMEQSGFSEEEGSVNPTPVRRVTPAREPDDPRQQVPQIPQD
jgi:hypothetical protein